MQSADSRREEEPLDGTTLGIFELGHPAISDEDHYI